MKNIIAGIIILIILIAIYSFHTYKEGFVQQQQQQQQANNIITFNGSQVNLIGLSSFKHELDAAIATFSLDSTQNAFAAALCVGFKIAASQPLAPTDLNSLAVGDYLVGTKASEISGNTELLHINTSTVGLQPETNQQPITSATDSQIVKLTNGQTATIYAYSELIQSITTVAMNRLPAGAYTYIVAHCIVDSIMAGPVGLTIPLDGLHMMAIAAYTLNSTFLTSNSVIAGLITSIDRSDSTIAAEKARIAAVRNVIVPPTTVNLNKSSRRNMFTISNAQNRTAMNRAAAVGLGQPQTTAAECPICPDMGKYLAKTDVENNYISKNNINKNYLSKNYVEDNYISQKEVDKNYLPLSIVQAEYIKRDAIPCWGCSV